MWRGWTFRDFRCFPAKLTSLLTTGVWLGGNMSSVAHKAAFRSRFLTAITSFALIGLNAHPTLAQIATCSGGSGSGDITQTACGNGALAVGADSTSVGFGAGYLSAGSDNQAFGAGAGALVTGSDNAALGYAAGQSVSGSTNIAIGKNAGQYVLGSYNTPRSAITREAVRRQRPYPAATRSQSAQTPMRALATT